MIKLADAVRKKLITEGECATLVLQGIKEITMDNIDKLNVPNSTKNNLRKELNNIKKNNRYNFLYDENGNINGIELHYEGKTFEGSRAKYFYIKLEKSSWEETDYYGYTKCRIEDNVYTTLVSISLGINVSFGEYTFPNQKLEHRVARYLQNVAYRLDQKIRKQEVSKTQEEVDVWS